VNSSVGHLGPVNGSNSSLDFGAVGRRDFPNLRVSGSVDGEIAKGASRDSSTFGGSGVDITRKSSDAREISGGSLGKIAASGGGTTADSAAVIKVDK
jgi:hypothetical protein